jgi:type I restriction enzyme, R subunit
VAVVHAAVAGDEGHQARADFEVYLKKFLQSLDLILPNPAGHPYRGPAKRFGYLLRMVKERYKDDSLDIADAGREGEGADQRAPDRAWASTPRFRRSNCWPTTSSTSVQQHAQGQRRGQGQRDGARHPQALHVHFDEDPAFYKR